MKFKEFANKMLDDPKFRQEVRKDPKAALEHAGMKPTEQHINALKQIDYKSLEKLVEAFEEIPYIT